jgi:hypothetical protein
LNGDLTGAHGRYTAIARAIDSATTVRELRAAANKIGEVESTVHQDWLAKRYKKRADELKATKR